MPPTNMMASSSSEQARQAATTGHAQHWGGELTCHGGVRRRVRGAAPGGAGVAEQGRQRVAADGGDAGGHPVHAGAGGAVRQHREEEVGRELGLHGALRLRLVAAGVGAGRLPHGVRGAPAPVLGQGRGGALPGVPGPPRLALGHGARGHRQDGALLPGGHAGAVPVRVRRHHAGAPGRLRPGPHEHQGLDGLHPALAPPLLHRRRLQPLGRRLPLPLGRHRLLRRIRHPPLLRGRRLHRRLLGGPSAEERPGALLPQQHPADDRRRRAAVDGLGRVQRRRALRRQHRSVRGRAQHQRLRRHQPPNLDLPRRHLLRQAVRHRRRAGHDDGPRLHHPWSRAGADMGGGDRGRVRGQRAVVHHDDPAQEVGAADAGGRHAGGVPHPRRRGPAGRRPHGAAGHAEAPGDRVPRAGPPRRLLRRRDPTGREAAGGRRVRGGVERSGHLAHPARHRHGGAAADARRAAHDRRRRRARGGGLRALGRRGEVRRRAARRVQGRRRRRHGEGGLGGAAAVGHGSQGRHHPAVGRDLDSLRGEDD